MIRELYRKSLKQLDLNKLQRKELLSLIETVNFKQCRTITNGYRDGLDSANNMMFRYISGQLLAHDAFESDSMLSLIETPKIRVANLQLNADDRRAVNAVLSEFVDGLSFILSDEQTNLFVEAAINISRPSLFRFINRKLITEPDYLLGLVSYSAFINENFRKSLIPDALRSA